MQAPNYYSWLNARRHASAAMDASPDWDENKVKREAKGGTGGGRFAKKPETLAKEDQRDILDPVEQIERNATPAEKAAVAKGGEPEGGRFEPVSPDDLPTMKRTNSKYRKLRNSLFEEIERRKAAGETDLDGTYAIDDPPPRKVQHKGADGQMHDGFADGFQVSFQTTNGEGYNSGRKDLTMSDADYDATVEKIAAETGSKPYVGVFGGIPEVSFRCDTKEQALEIAKSYNQVSIADNGKIARDEWDQETFPFNKTYEWRENQTWKMK